MKGLTAQERKYFDEKGFIIIKNVLSQHEINDLEIIIDKLGNKFNKDKNGRMEIRNCVAHHPFLLNLINHQDILPIVVDLLGPNIKIRSSEVDVRSPLEKSTVKNEL